MKPKYTLTLKDNETGEVILDLDVEKTSLSLSQKANVQQYHSMGGVAQHLVTGIKVDIQAEGFVKSTEEKAPNVYDLDEDECSHEWVEWTGLANVQTHCKICGEKKT